MPKKDCIYKVTLEEEKVFKTKIQDDPTEVRIVAVKGDKGDPGDPGEPGPANTLSIGTVTTGETASATITGDAPNQTLNLVMPEAEYSAGNGINISDGEISVDTSVVAEVSDIPTKTSDLFNDGENGDPYVGVSDIGNGKLTIKRNNQIVDTFTANDTNNVDVNISVPTKTSELENNGSGGGSPYAEISQLPLVGDGTLEIQRNGTSAQTFTANSAANKIYDIQAPIRVDMLGQCQKTAYVRSVIALCKVSTTDNTAVNSFSSGRLTFHRYNGAAADRYIDFMIGNKYAYAYEHYFAYSSNLILLPENANLDNSFGFRPCVFKYNDIWYAGIEYHASNGEQNYVAFNGELFNMEIFGVDYYKTPRTISGTSYPSEVTNQEVYDSLDFTKTDWQYSKICSKSLATEDGVITSTQGSNTLYTATLPTKSGTLAMTTDIPAKTSDLTNDGSDGNGTYIENALIIREWS